MKILTLNTHSIIEEDYETKLKIFVDGILTEKPEVFALQEVNQTVGAPIVFDAEETGFVSCEGYHCAIFKDNHAFRVAKMLKDAGLPYVWTWIPLKIGYSKYEEGLAVFSQKMFESFDQFYISSCQDMNNWKTRKMLGVKTYGYWFYSTHMGWWDDREEPFAKQWDKVTAQLGRPQGISEPCFILGDFNTSADKREQGYDYVVSSGWYDTFALAKEKDAGYTVEKKIDGWENRKEEVKNLGMRIDYIWTNKKLFVKKSSVVFNGACHPVVSDHYGVMIEI